MKKGSFLLLALLLVTLLLAGCGAAAPAVSGSTQLENPMDKMADADAVNKQLGTNLTVPEGANDTECFVIDDTIGQLTWRWRGVSYTYRAAVSADDISGIYSDITSTEKFTVKARDKSTEVTFNVVDNGCYAVWFWGDVQYSLHGNTAYEPDVQDMAKQLAAAGAA